MSRKEWCLAKIDKTKAEYIAQNYDLDPFIALLLTGREIVEADQIEDFFSDAPPQMDPYDFIDMDKCVDRIEQALINGEKIAIYGDYDADGVTSTAILYSYLSAREANVIYYIPERMTDGYGLNNNAIDYLASEGVNLIITVDNGITAYEEAQYIKELAMELVITDHHRAPEVIPEAVAVVDAYREDCNTTFKGLSGAGVALKLVTAMEGGEWNDIVEEFVDLATIGILADISPVYDENRRIIKKGIESINNTNRIGIAALIEASGMKGKEITSGNLMFSLIPRINAAGRIGKAARMVRLFLTDDQEEAREIANQVNTENAQRKNIEVEIIKEIDEYIEKNPEELLNRILVFKGIDWHHGVLGITASRIAEKYGKPAIILTNEEDSGIISGSCRSIADFSIFDAINACADELVKFGGHTLAAGISLKEENFDSFKKAINDYAKSVAFEMPFQKIDIECKIPPAGLAVDLVKTVSAMEPFGVGNREPVFGLYGYSIESIYPLSEGKHIKINLFRDNKVVSAVKFNTDFKSFPYKPKDKIDAAVSLSLTNFRGEEQLSVIIKEIKFADCNHDDILNGIRIFESFLRREELQKSVKANVTPNRDEIAEVYRFLRNLKSVTSSAYVIYNRLGCPKIPYAKFLIILEILAEKELIEKSENGDALTVKIVENPQKQDLFTASAYEYLQR